MKANINKYEFSKLLSSYEERIKYLENENKELKNQNENLITENTNLVEQLNLFKSFIFASKSEKKVKKPQDNKQLLLFDEAELFSFNNSDDEVQKKNDTMSDNVYSEDEISLRKNDAKSDKNHLKNLQVKKRGRKPISPKIPREIIYLDIPEDDKLCKCGC